MRSNSQKMQVQKRVADSKKRIRKRAAKVSIPACKRVCTITIRLGETIAAMDTQSLGAAGVL